MLEQHTLSELADLELRLKMKLAKLAAAGQQTSEDAVLTQGILKFVLFLVQKTSRNLRDSDYILSGVSCGPVAAPSVATSATPHTICFNCQLKSPGATHCVHAVVCEVESRRAAFEEALEEASLNIRKFDVRG